MGGILGAAVAPIITLQLWQFANGNLFLVGMYLSTAALMTIVALVLSAKLNHVDYESNLS